LFVAKWTRERLCFFASERVFRSSRRQNVLRALGEKTSTFLSHMYISLIHSLFSEIQIAKSTVCMAENQDLGKKVKRTKGDKAVQPEFFQEAKVICNGQEVMTVGGTQAEYVVDIWSGNHPFFQGKRGAIMTDVGQVTRFGDKYGDLGDLSFVETMDGKNEAGEAKTVTRGKAQKK